MGLFAPDTGCFSSTLSRFVDNRIGFDKECPRVRGTLRPAVLGLARRSSLATHDTYLRCDMYADGLSLHSLIHGLELSHKHTNDRQRRDAEVSVWIMGAGT